MYVCHVPFVDQIADILTKSLSAPRFQDLQSKLMVIESHVRLQGMLEINICNQTNNMNKDCKLWLLYSYLIHSLAD